MTHAEVVELLVFGSTLVRALVHFLRPRLGASQALETVDRAAQVLAVTLPRRTPK